MAILSRRWSTVHSEYHLVGVGDSSVVAASHSRLLQLAGGCMLFRDKQDNCVVAGAR